MKQRNYCLSDEAFLSQMENLISTTSNYLRSRLSPCELYALRYEFLCETVVNKQTIVTQITTKALIGLLTGKRPYTLLMHEQNGLLVPDEAFVKFTKNNNETFDNADLLASLNKRMTFFVGNYISKPTKQFVVQEVFVYIPSKLDTTIYLERFDFDNELIEEMLKSGTQVVDSIFQNGLAVTFPDFEKEFFALTEMKVDGATFVFHYIP